MCVSESELVIPALRLIKEVEDTGITTTELIQGLFIIFKEDLSEKDLSILSGRRDTHFSQTVRNLNHMMH